jgi:ribosomal protein L7/L12
MVLLENKSRIPDIYFAYSKDFDYRKYLEEKSHSDEVVLAVDRSTSEIVGAADRLTERVGVGVRVLSSSIDKVGNVLSDGFNRVENRLAGIDQTLQSGFETLSFDLNTIDRSINELSFICDLGFQKLAAETIRSNELLEELVTLFKTPDQVWAREQFDNAKECVARELWDDALKYSNKSIQGDERNSGYHIEPAFHFLKGKILIQYPEVGDGSEFLNLALGNFLDAAKYCGKEHQKLKALSLLQASWCHYCLGDFDSALKAISDSIEGDRSNPLSHFLKAKYATRTGDVDVSATSLRCAILADEILYLRAVNDKDFIQSSLDLDETAKLARDFRKKQFKEFLKDIRFDELARLEELASSIGEEMEQLKSIISTVKKYEDDQTLSSLNSFFLRGSKKPGSNKYPYPDARDLSADLAYEVRAMLVQRGKIETIKHVRQETNWDLKEAKAYVETVECTPLGADAASFTSALCEAQEIRVRVKEASEDTKRRIQDRINSLKTDSHREIVADKISKRSGGFDDMMGWGMLVTGVVLFFLFSSWWPNAPTLIILIGAVVAAFFTYPVATWGAMIISKMRAVAEEQSEFSEAKSKAERANQKASERARQNHAKGRLIEEKYEAILVKEEIVDN